MSNPGTSQQPLVAEIVAVGTELLMGQTVNTNAAFLAQQLANLSVHCYYQTVVGDNPKRLTAVLEQAFERADVVCTIGGLGPTRDDLTKETVTSVLGVPLEFNQDVWKDIQERYRIFEKNPGDSNRKQAMIPQGGEPLFNPHGTAPGVFVDTGSRIAICLPGPPREFEPMVLDQVVPRLARRSPQAKLMISRILRVVGIGESSMEEEISDLIEQQTNPTIAPYAKLGEVHLRLTANASSEAEAGRLIDPLEAEIRSRLGDHVYGTGDASLEAVTGQLLQKQGRQLAVAESCTGGLLGQRFTSVAGSSAYFCGGVIAYSNELKERLLSVPQQVLEEHGAVSEQTARAMAAGALKAAGADAAIAITGIAGPGGGSEEKPVGLVYIAWALGPGQVDARRLTFPGDRQEIRYRASQAAIDGLRRRLLAAGRA